jgi:mono/diheme cytochrome c family protein
MLSRVVAFGLFAVASSVAPASAQSSIERGAYLVNAVMTCHNCHTPMTPNGPDFSRALSGGPQVFDEPPFTVKGSNITPDPETGIGKWSDADIKKLLRKGERPNGVHVAPIMPTGFYEILTERDLDAIVAYLRSVKPVKNEVQAPVYKMAVQRQVIPGGEKPMPESAMSDPVKRGFYIATAAHCMECHTSRTGGHADYAKSLGKGGMEFKGPWGVSVARNITSHKEKGLGAWSDDEIKRAITQGISRDGSKLKPPMGFPYYARLTPEDLNAMVAWLRTVPPLP